MFHGVCDHKINEIIVKKLNCIAETLAPRKAGINDGTPPIPTPHTANAAEEFEMRRFDTNTESMMSN
ncbi:hypothetical protein EMCRGX_G014471 [Ephydatia muelleri]